MLNGSGSGLSRRPSWQPARDGVFLERLTALLKNGPTDPELRLRWSAHSRGVRGDDVIDAPIKEWDISTQQLDAQMSGNAWVMLPNPRYDPHAPEQVVEHLLLAARGGDPGYETSYFSGVSLRWPALSTWCRRPGLASLWSRGQRGKVGSGRPAGQPVQSDRTRPARPRTRRACRPGRAVRACPRACVGSTVERLVQEIDDQLVRAGVLSPHPGGARNRGDLLGAPGTQPYPASNCDRRARRGCAGSLADQ